MIWAKLHYGLSAVARSMVVEDHADSCFVDNGPAPQGLTSSPQAFFVSGQLPAIKMFLLQNCQNVGGVLVVIS